MAATGILQFLPMLFPLIQKFLKGKSGDELAGMLGDNQDNIMGMLSQFLGKDGGNLGNLQNLLGSSGTSPFTEKLIMKQLDENAKTNEDIRNTLLKTPNRQLDSLDHRLKNVEDNVAQGLKAYMELAKKLNKEGK